MQVGTDHEDLGRRHGPEGGGPRAREAREALEGVQHRAVALDQRDFLGESWYPEISRDLFAGNHQKYRENHENTHGFL